MRALLSDSIVNCQANSAELPPVAIPEVFRRTLPGMAFTKTSSP